MNVTLDGRQLETEIRENGTLHALIDRVREAHLNGRLVVSVTINGRSFVEDELSERLAGPVEPGDRIELESGDPGELAAEALHGVAEQLADSGRVQAEIAESLNAGNVVEAVKRIGEFVAAWQTCQKAIGQCGGLLGRDLTTHVYDGRAVSEHLNGLVDKLREIRDALETRDYVLLADLFHYEMPELCENWRGLLNDIADSLGPSRIGV